MGGKIAIIVIELEPETKNVSNEELEFYIAEEIENGYKIPWLKKIEKVTVLDYPE